MKLIDIQKYADKLYKKGLDVDEIKSLVGKYVGTEEVTDEEGNSTKIVLKFEESEDDNKIDVEIKKVAKKAVEDIKKDFVPERKVFSPSSKIDFKKVVRYNTLKVFQTEEEAYTSGQFFRAAIYGNTEAKSWLENSGIEMKQSTQVEGTNTLGGYLVPQITLARILDYSCNYGVFRANAQIIPMGGNSLNIPVNDDDCAANWTGETAAITQTNQTQAVATLTTNKLTAYVQLSSELMEDAIIDFGEYVSQKLASAIAFKTDQAGLLGDGSAGFGGFIGIVTAVNAAGATTNIVNWEDAVLADLNKLMGNLGVKYDNNRTAWYCSKKFYHQVLVRIAGASAGNTISTIGDKVRQQFMGYPVHFVNLIPTTGSNPSGSELVCLFGDFYESCLLGSRTEMSIFIDPYTASLNDLIRIIAKQRLAISTNHWTSVACEWPMVGLTCGG